MNRLYSLGFSILGSYALCKIESPEFIFDSALKSSFTITFIDKETLSPKRSVTGFFITEDGLGVTSGPVIKLYENCKIVVKLSDSKEYSGKVTHYPTTPGIGFIQVDVNKSSKLKIGNQDIKEGQTLYVMGKREEKVYFNDVMVTDNNHSWIQLSENDLIDTPVIRTTGIIPDECIGGPLIDDNGNAVAVAFNIEMGLGIGYNLSNLKTLYNENESWRIIKAWNRIRETIIHKFYKE